MLRFIIAAVAGGIVLFVWGFISWVVLGWHQTDGWALQNEDRVIAAIKGGDNEAGLYWLPGMPKGMDEEAWAQKHRQGPRGMLIYNPEGAEPLDALLLVKGLVIDIIGVAIAVIVLAMAVGHRGFIGRVAIVAMLGIFLAVMSDLTMWNFMGFPTDFTLVMVADHIIGWLAVGIVLAAIIKPKPAAAAA